MRIAGERKHSLVDGPGIRYVVFFQGCTHHCPGCHNPDTHDVAGGLVETVENIVQRIVNTKYVDGVTLSGGDPLLQSGECDELCRSLHEQGYNLWVYSGWTFEAILEDPEKQEVLKHIDVLVDGPFVENLKSENCIYRGSSNQRLIDVQKSLRTKSAVEYII